MTSTYENKIYLRLSPFHMENSYWTVLLEKLELVFVKHYAPNICLSPNMADFALS